MSNSFNIFPPSRRGTYHTAFGFTDQSTFIDIVNVQGHGLLHRCIFYLTDAGSQIEYRFYLDGKLLSENQFTGSVDYQVAYPSIHGMLANNIQFQSVNAEGSPVNLINLEFNTSLVFQIRRSSGVVANVTASIVYILDKY